MNQESVFRPLPDVPCGCSFTFGPRVFKVLATPQEEVPYHHGGCAWRKAWTKWERDQRHTYAKIRDRLPPVLVVDT